MGRTFDRTDGILAFLVLIWGTAFPVIPLMEQVLGPVQLTWYRYAPFPILYGAYLLLRRRGVFRQVTGSDWVLTGVVGCIGVLGYHLPLNWGVDPHRAGALTGATGAILVATTPLWTMLLAVATGREKAVPAAVAGTLVAFAGVAVVVVLGQPRAAGAISLSGGALVVLLAPISWAIYSVYTKPLVARYGGLFVTGTTLGIGTLALAPAGLSLGVGPLAALTPTLWLWLAFLALLSTALGYALWNQALKRRSASAVSAYIYFNPVVATVVGVLFFHEQATPWFLAGGGLVLGGVVLVNRARLAAARAGPPSQPPAPPPGPAAPAKS